MEHRQLNRIIGAVIFLIALVVYGMTVAKTTSYWDCGEFITCSYILGVPHPPGSPLYILIGRIFTMLPFFSDIGLRVNIISVLVSAFTIMFTYLIIVRLMREWRGIPQAMEEKLIIYTGGIVGALGLAFSDSFWFNAVEAEVYAVSMFFTAFVVWLILVWLEKAEEPVNDKYLMLIAYLIGLATGVHLLNILAIPTLFLIIYFKRAELKLSTFLLWSLGAVAVFGAIYPVIVKGIPWLLQEFSFWSVLTVAALLIGPFLIMPFAFQTSEKPYLIILLYVVLFNAVTLGSGNYTNPEVIKMNLFLIGFLVVARLARKVISNLAKNMMSGFKRTPLLHTVLLATTLILIGYSTYSMIYIRSGLKPAINENHPDVPSRFASYLNREQYGDIPLTERRAPVWEYQIKKMYVRYFGWQFIGKGSTLGSDNYIVETISTKGLMALPFLIGMIGMFQHFNRDWKRALSILTLFIMTGVAITLYLNQEDPQPRERDYAYVGSFFAFSIWIGIGASALLELVLGSIRQSQLLRKIGVTLTLVILFIAVPFNLFDFNYKSHNRTGNFV
ncbi:MAG: DUF2723 domain-containing protein, partial [Desulfobacterales bacterium]